jgi:signal transduction histidine kinase
MASTRLDEHRLRRLLEVGRGLVAELHSEAIFERLLAVARELTGARYAAIGVLDVDRHELERFLVSGIDEKTHKAIGDLPRGRGILGELIREPKPLRLDDISEHPRSYGFPPEHPPMTTFLGAPILIRGESWGNIYLTEKEGGTFDEIDEESLLVLAQWAAIAIENARLYERAEDRRDELERAVRGLEATTAIARAVGGETDLDRVLELVVKRGRALVEARSLLILLSDDDELVVAATAGESGTGAVGSRMPSAGTVPEEVLSSNHVERLADVRGRVRLGLGEVAADARTAMLVPLAFRGRSLGVLVALDRLKAGPEFSEEDERLMRSFAASAATAVGTAQSVEAEQLRRSVEAAEHERGRWARELHDETLQGLGALKVLLEGELQREGAGASEAATRQAVGQIAEEIEKLQALITELRPAALDALGPEPALMSLVERARAVHGLDIELDVDLDYEQGRHPTRHVPEIESTIYRLVQEALNNVAKHARAEHVWVNVVERDGQVDVNVRDDGQGLDQRGTNGGFGLIGMRERVDLVGGSLNIESSPGQGTTVHAEFQAAHRPPGDIPRASQAS